MNNRPEPQPILDVTRPGNTAAAPSGRPTITSNQVVTNDPMFTSAPTVPQQQFVVPVVPQVSQASPESIPRDQSGATGSVQPPVAQTPNLPASPMPDTQSSAEPLHKLTHQEAFFGHVGGHKKKGKLILFVVLVIIFAAAGYAAWTYRKSQATNASYYSYRAF